MHVMQLYLTFSWPLHEFLCQNPCFVVMSFSYLPFHTTFDRCLKVLLFCSPQWTMNCVINTAISLISTHPHAILYHHGTSACVCSICTSRLILSQLYFIHPKRRFWKEEQKMKSRFSTDFSRVRSPNRVLTPLKSASKIWISSFVPPSKIFVWGAYICNNGICNNHHTCIAIAASRWYEARSKFHLERTYCRM